MFTTLISVALFSTLAIRGARAQDFSIDTPVFTQVNRHYSPDRLATEHLCLALVPTCNYQLDWHQQHPVQPHRRSQ